MTSCYPWYEQNWEQIAQALQSDRMPHAVLLVAPRGSGKFHFASLLSQSLLCQDNRGKPEKFKQACGHCKSCELFKAQTHPDYYPISPLIDDKGKSKQNIAVDQIRHLSDKLNEKSHFNGWRIAILSPVSALKASGFNALLKTLEEPGENTLLILLSDNLHQVAPTIRSRCQIMRPYIDSESVADWLATNYNHDRNHVIDALERCHQVPFAALDYLENQGESRKSQLFDLFDQVLLNQLNPKQALEMALSDHGAESVWLNLSDYFYLMVAGKLKSKAQTSYQRIPKVLSFNLYDKLIQYQRGQLAGSNLNAHAQLQAILIPWYEAGRRIHSQ